MSRRAKFSGTTIIFGAGAHMPYGFPSSLQLTQKIFDLSRASKKSIKLFDHPTGYLNSLDECTQDKISICRIISSLNIVTTTVPPNTKNFENQIVERVDRFVSEFAGAQVDSIDTFLARRSTMNGDRETIMIGKIIVAYLILKCEKATQIGFQKKDWIGYLTNDFLRHEDLRELFFEDPPRIFSFNYDNYLENCIRQHLVSFHGISHRKAVEMVASLDITHIYGDLGTLTNDPSHLEDIDFYARSIKNIRVVGEERQDAAILLTKKVLSAISSSSHVYFMGFSFDDINTKIIFGNDLIRSEFEHEGHPSLYSSHINLTDTERAKIKDKVPIEISFPDKESSCYKLIREDFPIFQD